jgi:hypothetical protein
MLLRVGAARLVRGGVAPWSRALSGGAAWPPPPPPRPQQQQQQQQLKPLRPTLGGPAPEPVAGLPEPLELQDALGISESVLMYLRKGRPGAELDKVLKAKGNELVATRLRKTLGIYVSAQLYVVVPLGFDPTPDGLQQFALAQQEMVQRIGTEPAEYQTALLNELQNMNKEQWSLMLHRAFGINEVPEMPIEQLRYAASRVSSNMQNPAFLGAVKDMYENELKELAASGKVDEAHDKLQQKMVECFRDVVKTMSGFPEDPDDGFIVLQTAFNINMSDPEIQNWVISGFSAVHRRAPLQLGIAP